MFYYFFSLATDLVKEHFKDSAGAVFEHLAGGGEGGPVSKGSMSYTPK